MKIEILSTAEDDLADGHRFYERQEPGIGNYFLDTLFAEIDSLQLYAGTHRKVWGKFRMLSKRFPFGVFYSIEMAQYMSMLYSTLEDVHHSYTTNFAERIDSNCLSRCG